MKQVLTFEQKQKLITRAVGGYTSANGDVYIDALEDALIKSLIKGTEQRRELRRLNQSVRHINALEAQVAEGQREIATLIALLERDDEENEKVDTDPAPTNSFEFEKADPITEEEPFKVIHSSKDEDDRRYHEWDMRTRYPNLSPRKAG